jgi:hypothetical protein
MRPTRSQRRVDQVRGVVTARHRQPAGAIDLGADQVPDHETSLAHPDRVDHQAAHRRPGIEVLGHPGARREESRIPHLASRFRVERGPVEDDTALLAARQGVDGRRPFHQRDHTRLLDAGLGVAAEVDLGVLEPGERSVTCAASPSSRGASGRAAPHLALEAGVVDRHR